MPFFLYISQKEPTFTCTFSRFKKWTCHLTQRKGQLSLSHALATAIPTSMGNIIFQKAVLDLLRVCVTACLRPQSSAPYNTEYKRIPNTKIKRMVTYWINHPYSSSISLNNEETDIFMQHSKCSTWAYSSMWAEISFLECKELHCVIPSHSFSPPFLHIQANIRDIYYWLTHILPLVHRLGILTVRQLLPLWGWGGSGDRNSY